MKPEEYQKAVLRTENDASNTWLRKIQSNNGTTGHQPLFECRLTHAADGMITEAAEFLDGLKKWLNYGKHLDEANLKEELGDLLWYVALACDVLGLSLGDVMESNIAKLKTRYPEKFTDELAAEENRNRTEEMKAVNKED